MTSFFAISLYINEYYELLFRHIFETKIHIETQSRKAFILAFATNDFL